VLLIELMIIELQDAFVVAVISVFAGFIFLVMRSSSQGGDISSPEVQKRRNSDQVRNHQPVLSGPGLDVFPIYTIKPSRNEERQLEYSGTGFLIADGVLITCWHCIIDDLQPREFYAVMVEQDGEEKIYPLTEIIRHPWKIDMAKAHVDLNCRFGFELAGEDVPFGTHVISHGYMPGSQIFGLQNGAQPHHGDGWIESMATYFDNPYDESVSPPPSYRISFKAYSGISGSPVLKAHSNQLVGMVWGQDWAPEQKVDWEDEENDDLGSLILGHGEEQGANAYSTIALVQLMEEG